MDVCSEERLIGEYRNKTRAKQCVLERCGQPGQPCRVFSLPSDAMGSSSWLKLILLRI